ncbi:programmed cell death protein 6-like isoform 1 [Lichtheimia corymbifera JMRC:FSU:9682]|uniref:Programmed cell death protein 6-like isoform 1 n=1 Tax=Lichtheimia corymbifera JMRC:FSU:9682 TaxID=1263082 RepID=A0A068RLI4_9FUNG|nr:programmed cell death protein 6-like isoform 1 [Lichtheimia corymbifera JMRC:FSU:9682]
MAYNYQQSPYPQSQYPPSYPPAQGGYPPQSPATAQAPPPPGGYPPVQRPSMRPPPPGADPQLWYWFQIVDTDASGQLTVDELQRALINGDWTPFNIETVRMMVVMFDTDNTGTIDFNEFTGLWRYIEDWQRCFRTFDTDGSGNIDARELRHALHTFGYNLSEPFVNILIQKFDRYGRGNITFDNFVQVCATIRSLTMAFQRFDTDGDGVIQIAYEQFLGLVIQQRI